MENKMYIGFAIHTSERKPNFAEGFKRSDFAVNGKECYDYKIVGWANNRLAICEHIHKFELLVPIAENTNPMCRETLSLVQYIYELRHGKGKIHCVSDEYNDMKEKENDKQETD